MENASNDLVENIADTTLLENQPDFNFQALNLTGPDDEDDDEEEEGGGEEGDGGEASNDDNPPLDKNIVHSPLPPQTGGKPR